MEIYRDQILLEQSDWFYFDGTYPARILNLRKYWALVWNLWTKSTKMKQRKTIFDHVKHWTMPLPYFDSKQLLQLVDRCSCPHFKISRGFRTWLSTCENQPVRGGTCTCAGWYVQNIRMLVFGTYLPLVYVFHWINMFMIWVWCLTWHLERTATTKPLVKSQKISRPFMPQIPFVMIFPWHT